MQQTAVEIKSHPKFNQFLFVFVLGLHKKVLIPFYLSATSLKDTRYTSVENQWGDGMEGFLQKNRGSVTMMV